ncbi:hypothetical protein LCGC14_0378880 [marine sediment metagenome]|uniref:Uncharacterized protein n=1 Tax=marine sediment metagenome TaxID=412755 RepID=A0A0F9T2X3_9ZZZZ
MLEVDNMEVKDGAVHQIRATEAGVVVAVVTPQRWEVVHRAGSDHQDLLDDGWEPYSEYVLANVLHSSFKRPLDV